MAKIAQLVEGNYNILDNIPVINQDLTASGFTPVANTYYRHTGTNNTYTQGVIYYYDGTEYKALDGSGGGGGTTLNRYKYVVDQNHASTINYDRIRRICLNSKGKVEISFSYYSNTTASIAPLYANADTACINYIANSASLNYIVVGGCYLMGNNVYGTRYSKLNNDGTLSYGTQNPFATGVEIIYYNDTEIT